MEWWQLLGGILIGLLLLTFIVVVHELGHAFAGRRNKVEVEEFGIGFPPRMKVLGKQKETLVTLNWLLIIGGFCKFKGESDAATDKGTYGAASFWGKTQILLAGVAANFLLAVLIFTVLSLFGMPKVFETQWSKPSDTQTVITPIVIAANPASDSPAGAAGLEVGDEISSISGEEIKYTDELPRITEAKRGETVEIEYRRDGVTQTKEVSLREKADGGYLGVSVGQSEYFRATWSAPLVGVVNAGQFAWWTLDGLGQILANFGRGLVGSLSSDEATREQAAGDLNKAGDSVSGPIGILGIIFPNAVMAGATQLAFVAGLISIALGIMNLLPIPGLDGGRWLLTAIFKIIRKPLTEDLEAKINGIGTMCLFGLIILITFVDILKIL
jgi:regulator of sigma E protease